MPGARARTVRSLEKELPATPAAVPAARHAVVRLARSAGMRDGTLGDLALAVSEAVGNAVVHAYTDRPPGRIRIAAKVRRGEILVVVRDDGMGFRPRVDSPGLGLGLPLIARLTSSLDLRETRGGGTELRMAFRI